MKEIIFKEYVKKCGKKCNTDYIRVGSRRITFPILFLENNNLWDYTHVNLFTGECEKFFYLAIDFHKKNEVNYYNITNAKYRKTRTIECLSILNKYPLLREIKLHDKNYKREGNRFIIKVEKKDD